MYSVPLKNLYRELDALAEVRGRVRLAFPAEVTTCSFSRLDLGEEVERDGLRLRVVSAGPLDQRQSGYDDGAKCAVELDVRGAEGCGLFFTARTVKNGDERGEAIPLMKVPGRHQLRTVLRPVSLVVKVIRYHEKEYPFRLTDISLNRPPRGPEPARFTGFDRPVEASLIERDATNDPRQESSPTGVTLRLFNRTQKPVEKVVLKLIARDGFGRALAETTKQVLPAETPEQDLPRGNERSGPPPILIRPGSSYKTQLDISDLPVKRAKVDLLVTSVEFADATSWPP